jgi:uncharacterized protein YhaN
VRIERVQVRAFGRLSNFDSGAAALPGLVVVLGPNEAGKSTLFHFLTTMLYGFHPASREGNPYLPWDGEDASGSARLRLDGDGCVEVERYLRSQPGGRLTIDGRVDDLRNRALPWVDHIPRSVFRQVFAVTLKDLAGLDAETWARIQDRILGSMGATDLLPARSVADVLEQEAGALWRPHRRGNQRVRKLQEHMRTLRSQRRQAIERDRDMRALAEELERTSTELYEAREARERERVAVERVQTLTPIRRQLVRIAALREEGGARGVLESLPSDPGAHLRALEARVAELADRTSEIDRDLQEPEAGVASYDERARSLLERFDEVESFLALASGTLSDRARHQGLKQEASDLARRIDELGRELLAVPLSEAERGAISALSARALRARVRDVHRARDERRLLDDVDPKTANASRTMPAVAMLMTLLGVALIVSGSLSGLDTLTVLGAAGGAIGLTLLIQWQRARITAASAAASPGPGAALVGARRQERETHDLVLDLLKDIPTQPALLEEPSEDFASDFERLQGLLRDHGERSREEDELGTRLDRVDAEATALAGSLELEAPLETEALTHLLDRELRRAERLREGAAAADRELRRLRRERVRLAAELGETEASLQEFTDSMTALGGGDLERGVDATHRRLAAHTRADELEDELERTHPDLDELRERIGESEEAGESWTVDEHDLASRRAGIEQLSERIELLATRAKGLERDIAHLHGEETVDAVDGEIAGLQDEEARLMRERDRRWVLAQLIRDADRRFREEHQPDLIRRAGAYLKHLTGGRYDRILVNEAGAGDVFQVLGPDLPAPIPLTPPISTGTLEQAYLSLRLAIVDHLDQGGERLPLFVDEVFVNWDRERRSRGIEVLGSLSRSRQLFVFTCHPELAEEFSGCGAAVLTLEG